MFIFHCLPETAMYMDLTPQRKVSRMVAYGPGCLGGPWCAVEMLREGCICHSLCLCTRLWAWTSESPWNQPKGCCTILFWVLAHCCQPWHRPPADLDTVGSVAHRSGREQKATLICRGKRGLSMNRYGGMGSPFMMTLSPQGNAALVQAVCLHGHNAVARTPAGTHPLEEDI